MATGGIGTVASFIEFMRVVGKLKTTARAGWVRQGITHPESVGPTTADHMYRMSMIAMTLPVEGVDHVKMTKLAIVHDLAESIVGDITPHDGVSREEKQRREQDAMSHISTILPGAHGEELLELWQGGYLLLGPTQEVIVDVDTRGPEYETSSSKEAQLVHDIDKLDMVMQALEYEEAHGKDLGDFFENTGPKLTSGYIRNCFDEIVALRPAPASATSE